MLKKSFVAASAFSALAYGTPTARDWPIIYAPLSNTTSPGPNDAASFTQSTFVDTELSGNVSDFVQSGAEAALALVDSYDSSNWFSKFRTMAISDPTHGFVNYLSDSAAKSSGLYQIRGNQIYIGVDSTSKLNANGPGRNSVRIESSRAYTRGLVIGDFAHIPGSACGSWPAFWMYGPNWPNSGEIDIIEGVHTNTVNQVALHTSPGCTPGIGSAGEQGSRVANADCGAGGGFNGCGVLSNQATSYGTPFNANGGGVYATYWTTSGIQVWYWAQRDVPGDIRNGNPNPAGWGRPMANFQGGCDYAGKFQNMNIVFDITFCGDWAGGVWGQTSCASINPSCNAYVAEQPQSFGDVYWLINSVKVYGV